MIPALALAAGLAAAQPVDAPDDAWRAVDQDDLLYITVARKAQTGDPMEALLAEPETGLVIVELYPEFAPNHVARMKALANDRFYDGRVFHRVIAGFMAQGGGTPEDPSGGDSGRPDLEAEFTARLGPDADIVEVQAERPVNPRIPAMGVSPAGIYRGAPIGFQPAAQAMVAADGKRDAWILHCKGTASTARTSDPNSGNFQFFLMRGDSPWLDAQYTAWGRIVHGQDVVDSITLGEPPADPDRIQSVRVGASLPESRQVDIEVLRTDSAAFRDYAEAQAVEDVCDLAIPTRTGKDG